jgi:hypothetical protein
MADFTAEVAGTDFSEEAAGKPGKAAAPPTETGSFLPGAREFLARMGRAFKGYGGPEAVGFALGEAAEPAGGGIPGAMIGTGVRQILEGRPDPGEAALTGAGIGTAEFATPYVAKALRALSPRTWLRAGVGKLTEIPGIRQVFERMGVTPTLADLTGAKVAGQMENLAGSIPTSSGIVRKVQQSQNEQLAEAYEKTMGSLGKVETRAATGKSAVEGITENFRAMQETGSQMRANISKLAGDEVIPSTNYRAQANRLAKSLRLIKDPGKDTLTQIARLDKIAKGPEGMSFDSWYETQTHTGSKAGDVNLLSTQERGIEKSLFKAMQKDLDAWSPKNPEAYREVKAFKAFYKNNIVPFNDSLPGRVAAGKINPEDAASRVFSKDGLTELQDVKRWAGGQLFYDLRNRWMAGVMEKTVNPQTGQFNMGNFRRAWNGIDREVKQRAFSATERKGLDDLATVSERIGGKYTTAGGGSPSGTPLGQVPYFQAGAFMGGAGSAGAAVATYHPALAAVSVAEMLASYQGPRWLARMVTTPEGIEFMLGATKIPASTPGGQALLAGLTGRTAQLLGGSNGER